MSLRPISLKCPVCNARFRGTVTCSRCGADLEPLMTMVARAWQLRRRAVRALAVGDPERALIQATHSRRLHDTPQARKTALIARMMLACEESFG
jgi:predicted amidophosphoribosyltransferase